MTHPHPRRPARAPALAAGALLAALAAAGPAAAEETAPSWASLGSDQVNLRVGPGMRYPIDWVFTTRWLPVRILRSHDHWREVQTSDGTRGWVHRSLLSGERTALVREEALLLRRPAPDSEPRARVMPGAVVRLEECGPAWCEVRAGRFRGHLPSSALWGAGGGG